MWSSLVDVVDSVLVVDDGSHFRSTSSTTMGASDRLYPTFTICYVCKLSSVESLATALDLQLDGFSGLDTLLSGQNEASYCFILLLFLLSERLKQCR